MSTASALTQRMNETGRKRTGSGIFVVISDDHNVHCLGEAHLDAWWHSLQPEQKAEICENDLDTQRPVPSPELSAKCAKIAANLKSFLDKPWHAFPDRSGGL